MEDRKEPTDWRSVNAIYLFFVAPFWLSILVSKVVGIVSFVALLYLVQRKSLILGYLKYNWAFYLWFSSHCIFSATINYFVFANNCVPGNLSSGCSFYVSLLALYSVVSLVFFMIYVSASGCMKCKK